MLFAPPTIVETEVFARLSETYRRLGRSSEWLTAQLRGRDHHSLLEGPTFDSEGNLYMVDVLHSRAASVCISPRCRYVVVSPSTSLTVVFEGAVRHCS